MTKKKRKSRKGKTIKRRDPILAAAARHEIDLRTKSSSVGKKKYSRKTKHKKHSSK